jgi:Kef-type K+ transport system membrane component KefB
MSRRQERGEDILWGRKRRMFSLAGADLARFLFALVALLVSANVLGYVAERLTIPRVIGEVAGGLLLGPTLMGYFFPGAFHWLYLGFPAEGTLFGLLYQLGMIMLMFNAGLKFQSRFEKSDMKLGVAIIAASTVVPFLVGWLSTYLFDPAQFLGPAQNVVALKIVVAISIAVTSFRKSFRTLGLCILGSPRSSSPLRAFTTSFCGSHSPLRRAS